MSKAFCYQPLCSKTSLYLLKKKKRQNTDYNKKSGAKCLPGANVLKLYFMGFFSLIIFKAGTLPGSRVQCLLLTWQPPGRSRTKLLHHHHPDPHVHRPKF